MPLDYIFILNRMLTAVLRLQALSRWTFFYSKLRCWLSMYLIDFQTFAFRLVSFFRCSSI